MASATLMARMVGDASKLIDEFDKAGKGADGLGARMTKASTVFTAAGAAMGAAAIAAAGASVLSFANAGSALHDMSARTGVTVQALSELKFAAEMTGSSAEGLETGIRKMQKAIVAAAQSSSGESAAFTALGLTLADLKNLSPDQQFDKVASSLASIEDPTVRAGLAMQVFGKSGTELLPMLADGTAGLDAMRQQARDLGITMDDETAAKADRLGDAIDAAKASIYGLTLQMGGALAPAISAIAEGMSRTLPQAFERASDAIRTVTQFLGDHKPILIGVAVAIAALMVPALFAMAAAAWGAVTGFIAMAAPLIAVAAAVGLVTAAVVWLWENWDSVFSAMPESIQSVLSAIGEFVRGMGSQLLRFFNWLIDQLNKINVTLPDWLGGGSFGINIPKVEVMFEAVASIAGKAVGAVKSAVGSLGGSATDAAPKVAGAAIDLDSLGAAAQKSGEKVRTLADVMEQIDNDNMQRRIDAYLKGGIALSDAQRVQNDQMVKDATALADTLHEIFGISLPDAMETAMKHVVDVADTMKKATEDALKKVKQDAFDLTRQLWSATNGGGGNAQNAANLARLAEMAAKGQEGSMGADGVWVPKTKMAAGGIVRARPGGTIALLGEAGRDEAVVPLGGNTGTHVIHVDIGGQRLADIILEGWVQLESTGRVRVVTA